MVIIGIGIGCFLCGVVFGLCGSLLFALGFRSRGRADSGQPMFGKAEPLEPVVNTDPEFIDGIRQDRYENDMEPYLSG